MCTEQAKGGTSVEEQTKGGIPHDESTRGGAPSEEYFPDKLPISTNGAKISVHSELSAESNETPNVELFKEASNGDGSENSRGTEGTALTEGTGQNTSSEEPGRSGRSE